jgi:hypothetical protein
VPKFSKEIYRWAVCVFQTRSATAAGDHTVGGAVMLPYYDLMNHAMDPNAVWYFDREGMQWMIRNVRRIQRGEEITDSYGCRSNPELLSAYGFFVPNSQCDRLVVPLGQGWEPMLGRTGVVDEATLLPKIYVHQFGAFSKHEPFDASNIEHRRLTFGFIRDKAQAALRSLQVTPFMNGTSGEVRTDEHNSLLHAFVLDRQDLLRKGIEALDEALGEAVKRTATSWNSNSGGSSSSSNNNQVDNAESDLI